MIALSKKKTSAKPFEKSARRKGVGFARGLLVFVVSVVVAVLIVFSLWISVGAITQKIKVSRETSQIIDIVDMTRRLASLQRNLGNSGREDILAKLAQSAQIDVAESKYEGLSTVANPWGGTVTAYTVPTNLFRIETVVPSRACVRILDLLTQSIRSLGIQQIDAKGVDESWRQIFVDKDSNPLSATAVAAGCRSNQFVILDFTLTLR